MGNQPSSWRLTHLVASASSQTNGVLPVVPSHLEGGSTWSLYISGNHRLRPSCVGCVQRLIPSGAYCPCNLRSGALGLCLPPFQAGRERWTLNTFTIYYYIAPPHLLFSLHYSIFTSSLKIVISLSPLHCDKPCFILTMMFWVSFNV